MSGGPKITSAVGLHPLAYLKQAILPFANVDIRLAGASFLEFSRLFLPSHRGRACRDSRRIVSGSCGLCGSGLGCHAFTQGLHGPKLACAVVCMVS